MFPHPDFLVLIAQERHRGLLAEAERDRLIRSALGPDRPFGAARAIWHLLGRVIGSRRVEEPARAGGTYPVPSKLAP